MLYPLTPGIDIRTDTQPSEAPREEDYFAAGGPIPVGSPVVLDATSITGKTVIVATTQKGHLCRGVYEGSGGVGARPTLPGLSGRAAATGDVIRVTRHGVASSFVGSSVSSNAASPGVTLGLTLVNGVFTEAAQPASGLYACVTLLEVAASQGASSTAGIVKKVHLSLV